MTSSRSAHVLSIAERKRFVKAADVRAGGGSAQLLIKLHHAGKLRRVARGIYSLPEQQPSVNDILIEVTLRVPRSVVCLLSALQHHEVGTQMPHEVWIALPSGARTPDISYPPLRVVRLGGAAYTDGVETFDAGGTPVRIYSVAKTVADCFKFRHRVGLDVALEALKDAWRGRRVTMDELTHFARVNRVERVMRPYLEAMVS